MKYLIIFIIILSSCWDGEKNGKRFCLEFNCVKSHMAHGIRFIPCGKAMIAQPYTYFICDGGYYDTIWEGNTK